MRASALASTCTSVLLAALALGGEPPVESAAVMALELEARLARRPDIYLVVRPPERVLQIKARGVVLDSIPLTGVELVSSRRMLHERTPHTLAVPVVLTVTDGPGDWAREVIAPPELRPMPSEDELEEEAEGGGYRPSATPTPIPDPPSSYRAQLDNGWDLWICETLPSTAVLGRLWAAVRDGWDRLWGSVSTPRPALTLAMSRADAHRLFHLVGTNRPLLITAGS